MKKLVLTLFTTLTLFSFCFAQGSNLIVFSPDGDKFYLVLNGVKQNDKPETNVKVTNLTQPYMKGKIIFENTGMAEIEKNIQLVDLNNASQEVTYQLKRNNKGVMDLKWYSNVPIAQAPATTTGVTVIEYHTTPVATATVVAPGSSVSTTTTHSTTTTTSGTSDNVNMGVNVGGLNMGVNVSVNDGMGMGTSTSQTTYSQTTTTTSSSSYSTPPPSQEPVQTGCVYPMGSSDFSSAKSSISSKSFEDSKLTVAKQILNTNCLSTAQIKEICQLFSFEDSKLDFAKTAYGKTTDPNNYFKLNDVFSFESSITDLNNYISGH